MSYLVEANNEAKQITVSVEDLEVFNEESIKTKIQEEKTIERQHNKFYFIFLAILFWLKYFDFR